MIILLFLLAIQYAGVCLCERGHVKLYTELTEETFDSYIHDHDRVLVLYYDIMQKKSISAIDSFSMLGLADTIQSNNVKIVRVNSVKYNEIGERYKVKRTPSVALFMAGIQIPLGDKFDQASILEFVEERLVYSVETVASADEVDQTKHDYYIVYYTKESDSVMDKIIRGVKSKYYSISIYKATNGSDKMWSRKDGLVAFRVHDKFVRRYQGNKESRNDIERFIIGNEYPEFSYYNEKTQHWIDVEGLPVIVFLFEGESINTSDLGFNNIVSVSPKYKDTLLCVFASRDQPDKKIFEEFKSLDLSKVWAFIIAPTKPYHKKFVLYKEDGEEVLPKDKIRQFYSDYRQGMLSRYYMTQVIADDKKKIGSNIEVAFYLMNRY